MNPQNKQYDLLEILEIMKKNKVLKVQMGSLIVELSQEAFKPEPIEQEIKPKEPELPPLTDEDKLKIASPFAWR